MFLRTSASVIGVYFLSFALRFNHRLPTRSNFLGGPMNRRPRALASLCTALFISLLAAFSSLAQTLTPPPQNWPAPQEADFTVHDFHFQSGETLPELRLHYRTLGKPVKDAAGRTTNAVLILHGTGGSGGGLLSHTLARTLLRPRHLLEAHQQF